MNKSIALCFLARLIIVGSMLGGCSQADPYPERFQRISIGTSRLQVIDLLGEPSTVKSIEVPLMKMRVEQLAWNSPDNRREYIVHVVMGLVVSKSIVR